MLQMELDFNPKKEELATPQGVLLTPALTPASFFLHYWKRILGFLIIIGTVGVIWYQSNKIETLTANLRAETLKTEFIDAQLTECNAKYDELNESIKALSDTSKIIKNDIDSLKPAISKIRTNTNSLVADILNKPTPESCEEAIKFIQDNEQIFDEWKK